MFKQEEEPSELYLPPPQSVQLADPAAEYLPAAHFAGHADVALVP